VGLGNPGAGYRKTRHNAGFMLLDGMVEGRFGRGIEIRRGAVESVKNFFGIRQKFHKGSGLYTDLEVEIKGTDILLVKPNTFMNESGKALTSLRTGGRLKELADLLVIMDDVDLEIGRLRIRQKGSAGGHNGMKSIIDALGTDEFSRLRIGVGPRPSGSDMVEYVLGTFRPDEWDEFTRSLENAAEVVEAWVDGGFDQAQNELKKLQSTKN